MITRFFRYGAQLVIAAGFLSGLSGQVLADNVKVAAELKPTTTSSSASGNLTGEFDPKSKTLSYKVEYTGLSSAPVAAHFHGPAKPGEDAGVAVPVSGDLKSPITSKATLTDTQAAELLAGKYYFNLHTPANLNGELRGQVQQVK